MEYNEAKAQEICARIAAGEFLINIRKDEDLPTVRRCHQWLKENSEFKALHDDAVMDRLAIGSVHGRGVISGGIGGGKAGRSGGGAGWSPRQAV